MFIFCFSQNDYIIYKYMWKEEYLKIPAYVCEKSVVKEGAKILPFCVIIESEVGENSIVGPFAYLRPGSILREGSKVGAFCEVKKSVIGKGSKVPHLSYIGDAEIGESVNIGCGVVFCNYDGKNKHKTVVGDGAFVGANVNLVAPVKIGEGAFIAAGSTIVQDVGKNEMGIARARQENKKKPRLA